MTHHSVHIVDDDDQVRTSLRFLLETSGYDVETFVSGDAYIAAAPSLDDTVLILDVRMPGRDGLETLTDVRGRSGRMPVIMISGHGDIPLAVKAMQSGADDFVEKPFVARRILSAIERLQSNHASSDEPNPDPAGDALSPLTPREREVALHLSKGRPNKVIAHELGVSVRTVETHRARLMSKLGIKSVADLVRLMLGRPA
ncbi:response regulator [uncultured Algimonas sp.]|uniref:response regulator transcription factor n=1 Tax=uncultured Algimonas sp. TaxID=1547920 RepID=UPI0026049F55|nr:response regulator [uncultured Algimonas sp.]